MSIVRVGPKHQIIIPKQVRNALHLEAGDLLKVDVKEGIGVFIPQKRVEKTHIPSLTKAEKNELISAKKKIKAIREDLKNSEGLTRAEADAAAKVGLIDPEQKYWWLEEWQKGEREVERELESGEELPSFDNAEDALAFLKSQIA